MKQCKECGMYIYDSSNRRKLSETLINQDKRYENIVGNLCVNCLQREQKKLIKHKLFSKILEKMGKKK